MGFKGGGKLEIRSFVSASWPEFKDYYINEILLKKLIPFDYQEVEDLTLDIRGKFYRFNYQHLY